ncbi:TonB-dependent receptor family protein [Ornithobacterium rhinotracheale]|uniref:TonB-dependent receptor family protein n=1 Tax=Ornithobacterium rhinotracheale TaxID=28251 RepID=UPI0021590625|nr:TonB-dependent receptor [Ornithobacterium rhinotracheale]UVD87728.1 TonB-dependent receptor [Ornithobacterium rhinotracheale]
MKSKVYSIFSLLICLPISAQIQPKEKAKKDNIETINLNQVEAQAHRKKAFTLRHMKEVEGTSILAGKKTEVVLVDQKTANLATNNARQVYNQVVGLNIYDYNDGGLQLGIGGRGLDPNRTANFNTRQNGYDISADVLGYPESYYTPPTEALQEVQIIRGAASLQYGTQFGGMINFKFKEPTSRKKILLNSRQTIGSYNLFTSFNSLEGTLGKFSYYTFYNHKQGDGFRPNSNFNSNNAFGAFKYQFNENTSVKFEYTYFHYLAQQAGGLTDKMFYENPTFSNRSRNWFEVDWNLFNLNFHHKFSEKTAFDLNTFGLKADRKTVGFRVQRVGQPDNPNEARDLIVGDFVNWGAEARLLTKYNFFNKENALLLGAKYYQSRNKSRQGPGTKGADADFNFDTKTSPDYPHQSDFTYPNLNLAVFGENIFRITPKFSITPGIRFEYIDTQADGAFRYVLKNLAGIVIQNDLIKDDIDYKRSLVLLGIGASYKPTDFLEVYGNLSQNYRSVTFSDLHTTNPSFEVDKNIKDENGFTADLGFRGNFNRFISYDTNIFGLWYLDKIGNYIRPADAKSVRANVGDAIIYGLEFFAEADFLRAFRVANRSLMFTGFVNSSFSESKYIRSKIVGVEGKRVQFNPQVNLKTGINFGYKNFLAALQYMYVSEQFSDDSNSPQLKQEDTYGIRGAIPAYGIMDFSASYTYKRYKLEAGINNLLNDYYFVRRATGYPGPGIIPSDPRTFYVTFGFKL